MCWITNSILPQWLSAIGTLAATSVAIYLGMFGNKETKIFIKKIEHRLNQEDYVFLTSIRSTITSHMDEKTEYRTNNKQ
jgi:hypothetical protein